MRRKTHREHRSQQYFHWLHGMVWCVTLLLQFLLCQRLAMAVLKILHVTISQYHKVLGTIIGKKTIREPPTERQWVLHSASQSLVRPHCRRTHVLSVTHLGLLTRGRTESFHSAGPIWRDRRTNFIQWKNPHPSSEGGTPGRCCDTWIGWGKTFYC